MVERKISTAINYLFRDQCKCGCSELVKKFGDNYIFHHEQRGRKQSLEQIEKRVLKVKGQKRKSLSNVIKEKISQRTKLGMSKMTKEEKWRIGHSWIKQKRTKEWNMKISKSSFGKKMSEESKKKMSANRKGKISPLKGKKLSDIHRERIKLSKMTATPKYKEWRKTQVMPIIDTKIEVKIQNYLKELNIDFFTHQYIKEIEHGYQCDIFIPSINLVIECDGVYWHKYPIGTEIDHIRTKELIEKGFKVLRLWEHEINNMSLNQFQDKITEIKSLHKSQWSC